MTTSNDQRQAKKYGISYAQFVAHMEGLYRQQEEYARRVHDTEGSFDKHEVAMKHSLEQGREVVRYTNHYDAYFRRFVREGRAKKPKSPGDFAEDQAKKRRTKKELPPVSPAFQAEIDRYAAAVRRQRKGAPLKTERYIPRPELDEAFRRAHAVGASEANKRIFAEIERQNAAKRAARQRAKQVLAKPAPKRQRAVSDVQFEHALKEIAGEYTDGSGFVAIQRIRHEMQARFGLSDEEIDKRLNAARARGEKSGKLSIHYEPDDELLYAKRARGHGPLRWADHEYDFIEVSPQLGKQRRGVSAQHDAYVGTNRGPLAWRQDWQRFDNSKSIPPATKRANNDTGNPPWPGDHSHEHAMAARGQHFTIKSAKSSKPASPAKKRGK